MADKAVTRDGRDGRDARLAALDAALARDPAALQPRFERAQVLVGLGRYEEARQAYLDLLALAPEHFGALNNLGALLHEQGFRTAARTAYARAVACHPGEPMGHVNLANALALNEEWDAALHHYTAALAVAPDHAPAHQGLSRLLSALGREGEAAVHRRRGYTGHAVTPWPYRGPKGGMAGARILLLMSAAEGNLPILPFLDPLRHRVTQVMADFFDPGQPLPPHDRVINAIGDADRAGAALDAAEVLLRATDRPVLNPPDRVRLTGRADIARRLADIPGLRVPTVIALDAQARAEPGLAARLDALGWPLLVRAPGFHTGKHFEKVDGPADLAPILATLPPGPVLAISHLDARGADGMSRKYRVMMIGGRLFPLHLALSRHWKVHYFTADMGEDAAYRAEEKRFLDDMAGVLGPRAMAALACVRDRLGLDYGGIDFALDGAGDVLLFESNATMVVPDPPPADDARWGYRHPALWRAGQAVRALIDGRPAP